MSNKCSVCDIMSSHFVLQLFHLCSISFICAPSLSSLQSLLLTVLFDIPLYPLPAARVTIKEQTYTVDEDQRAVNICAVVSSPFPISDDCELDFSFSVRVVPIPGTAGECSIHSIFSLSLPKTTKQFRLLFHLYFKPLGNVFAP